MSEWKNDRRHQATCDWNLYADQREDNPDLCNIGCLDRPDEIAASWARLDVMPRGDGPAHCWHCGHASHHFSWCKWQ